MSDNIYSAWVEEVRLRLDDTSQTNSVLEEIKNHFYSIPGAEISQKVHILGLVTLLNRLCVGNTSNFETHNSNAVTEQKSQKVKEVECLCEILDICLPTLPVGYALRESRDSMLRALTHPNAGVREVIITELHRTCMTEKCLQGLESSFVTSLAVAMVRSIGDEELKVASKAMGAVSANEEWLRRPGVMEELKTIMDGNSSNRCKCFEVIINMSKKSPQGLEACVQNELIQRVLADIQTDDILLQLNVLQILTDLAVTTHGLQYLMENGVLRFVADMVAKGEVDGTSHLVTPGIMKFFGMIAHEFPSKVLGDLQESYPNVIEALFGILKAKDLSLGPVALDTLGFIGSTMEGKIALTALGHQFTSSIIDVGEYIRNSPTETRIRAIECVSNLIGISDKNTEEVPANVDQRIHLMTREWFRSLSESPPAAEMLFNLCKNPFPDLKLSGLSLLLCIVKHDWGKEIVKDTPGMIEYLLDRSVENDKEVKHLKYDIIKILSASTVFDVSVLLRLKSYVEEGPFYVQGMTEVAIEGD